MGKTLLGISYILLAIPYVNVIGAILVPIAWIAEGRRRKKGLWTATGILGLISIALVIVGVAALIGALLPMVTSIQHEITAGQAQSPQVFTGNFTEDLLKKMPMGLAGIAVISLASILYIIYFVLMLVSLYQAGSLYRSGLIKASVVLYIIGIIVMILFIAFIASSAVHHTSGEVSGMLAGSMLVGAVVAGIVLFIANILAGIGFLTAKEPEEQQYCVYGYPTPEGEGGTRISNSIVSQVLSVIHYR